jgi:hypothetical protein
MGLHKHWKFHCALFEWEWRGLHRKGAYSQWKLALDVRDAITGTSCERGASAPYLDSEPCFGDISGKCERGPMVDVWWGGRCCGVVVSRMDLVVVLSWC